MPMKNTILFSVISFMLLAFMPVIYAQTDIKLGIDRLNVKSPYLGLEFGQENKSLEIGVGANFSAINNLPTGAENLEANYSKVDRLALTATIRANYYPRISEFLDGVFVSPYASYTQATIKTPTEIKNTRIIGGILIGYKYMITPRLGARVEAGYGHWIKNTYEDKATKAAVEYENLGSGLNLKNATIPLGITFNYRIIE
jgi:hypothetical protein